MDASSSKLMSIVAGGAAGAAETICTYPAEYVKTRRQLPPSSTFTQVTSMPTVQPKPQGSLNVLRDTIRVSGVRGLYSGCSALVASNAAKGGIRFISFTQTQMFLNNTSLGASNPGLSTVLAGLTAGVVESILVVTPGEALKTKIIHDRSMPGGGRLGLSGLNLAQATARIIHMDGFKALWSGVGPVLCKQGTNSMVRFTTFSWIQEKIRVSCGFTGIGATLAAGAASGVVTTYASMPFDNIKTRMQSLQSKEKISMPRLALQMLRTEGISVFWRATTPRLVRLTMSSAITFGVFNQVVLLGAWVNQQSAIRMSRTSERDTL